MMTATELQEILNSLDIFFETKSEASLETCKGFFVSEKTFNLAPLKQWVTKAAAEKENVPLLYYYLAVLLQDKSLPWQSIAETAANHVRALPANHPYRKFIPEQLKTLQATEGKTDNEDRECQLLFSILNTKIICYKENQNPQGFIHYFEAVLANLEKRKFRFHVAHESVEPFIHAWIYYLEAIGAKEKMEARAAKFMASFEQVRSILLSSLHSAESNKFRKMFLGAVLADHGLKLANQDAPTLGKILAELNDFAKTTSSKITTTVDSEMGVRNPFLHIEQLEKNVADVRQQYQQLTSPPKPVESKKAVEPSLAAASTPPAPLLVNHPSQLPTTVARPVSDVNFLWGIIEHKEAVILSLQQQLLAANHALAVLKQEHTALLDTLAMQVGKSVPSSPVMVASAAPAGLLLFGGTQAGTADSREKNVGTGVKQRPPGF